MIKIKNLLRLFPVAALIMHALPCLAQPPKWVYRFDTRPPSEIFVNGFSSLGNNHNFIDHVQGSSTAFQSRNSAFIATTPDQMVAEDFAREALDGLDDGRYGYVYRIRATENFYNAQDTIENLYSTHADSPPIWLQEAMEAEEEYCAVDRIEPSQVESVVRLRFISGRVERHEFSNAAYLDGPTHANENPYEPSAPVNIQNGPVLLATPNLTTVDWVPEDLANLTIEPLYPVYTVDNIFALINIYDN